MRDTPSDLLCDPHVQALLALVGGTYRCARLLGRPATDFACGQAELRRTGVGDARLRTLVAGGYLGEVRRTARGKGRRVTQFVLTAEAAKALGGQDGPAPEAQASGPGRAVCDGQAARPHWDSDTGELWYGCVRLKKFKRLAPYQMPILEALERAGWPGRLDAPLPRPPGRGGAERLRKALECLNRGQCPRRLHFGAEADGRGLCWRVVGGGAAGATPSRGESAGERGET